MTRPLAIWVCVLLFVLANTELWWLPGFILVLVGVLTYRDMSKEERAREWRELRQRETYNWTVIVNLMLLLTFFICFGLAEEMQDRRWLLLPIIASILVFGNRWWTRRRRSA
jgi:hypothetical protein